MGSVPIAFSPGLFPSFSFSVTPGMKWAFLLGTIVSAGTCPSTHSLTQCHTHTPQHTSPHTRHTTLVFSSAGPTHGPHGPVSRSVGLGYISMLSKHTNLSWVFFFPFPPPPLVSAPKHDVIIYCTQPYMAYFFRFTTVYTQEIYLDRIKPLRFASFPPFLTPRLRDESSNLHVFVEVPRLSRT